jgi:hypothetical protein
MIIVFGFLASLGIAILAMLLSIGLSAYVSFCAAHIRTMRRLYHSDGRQPPPAHVLRKEAREEFIKHIKATFARREA